MLFTILLLIATSIGAFATPWRPPHHHPLVKTSTGLILGTTTITHSNSAGAVEINTFLGIPFASTPRRFSPPRPPRPWRGIHHATTYGPACIQQFNYPEASRNQTIQFFNTPPPPAGESEDCLTLNIWAPARKSKYERPRAVLFWLYGGALMFGSGSLRGYDGSSFVANQDVVLVTINYRTNVFGFPGSTELPPNERNLGWLDQRLALDWVQRNIHAFGGDPKRVTIFGESAGSGSVDALVTLPPEPIPFHAAIMQSGDSSIRNRADNTGTTWRRLAELAGCSRSRDTVRCIRRLPALKLKDIIERNALSFGPVHDSVTYAEHPQKRRLNSSEDQPLIARVPLIIGSNARDAWPLVGIGLNDTKQYLQATFSTFTDQQRKQILAAYPINTTSGIRSPAEQIAVITTEYGFQCPSKLIADATADAGIAAWRYYFNASFPNTQLFPGSGAFHSSEIGLVFGTYKKEGATEFQAEMSKAMQKAWADFAKEPQTGPGWDGIPMIGVLGAWEDGAEAVATVSSAELDARCKLFDELYASAI
ncbi:Carboxylesterase [Aspergillus granulosus]|uniref:Carboxylic ester hydrolase n=1 Tax=Aspergillus granulosus TaxID=176169 RepID=A0ABR4HFC3_9EURO